jgi:hypothetical protein
MKKSPSKSPEPSFCSWPGGGGHGPVPSLYRGHTFMGGGEAAALLRMHLRLMHPLCASVVIPLCVGHGDDSMGRSGG